MGKFIIGPHMRLQEWIAEEKGYFEHEGLDYEFVASGGSSRLSIKSASNCRTIKSAALSNDRRRPQVRHQFRL